MDSNRSNIIPDEDRRIRIELILSMKKEKETEKAALIKEEKMLNEELNKLLPNAFERKKQQLVEFTFS